MTLATDSTIAVRVLLFARYAEVFGTDAVTIDVSAPATVGAVLHALRSKPAGHLLPPHPLCAVNLAQASEDAVLRPGDEVAFLPPLAGG